MPSLLPLSTDSPRRRGRSEPTVHYVQPHLRCLLRHALRDAVLDDLCFRSGAVLQPPPPRVRERAALPLPQVLPPQLRAVRSDALALPHPPSQSCTRGDASADVDSSHLFRKRVLCTSLHRSWPSGGARRTHGPRGRRRSRPRSGLPRSRSSGPLSSLQPSEQTVQEVPRSVRIRKRPFYGLQYSAPILPLDETQSSPNVIRHQFSSSKSSSTIQILR